jgi:DNA-binding transcriptional LysR family regulator
MDISAMSPSLKQLAYIIAVQESGSFAKAAQKMNISQSSILAAVDTIEQDLGIRIFSRQKGRGVYTTAAGEKFITSARRLLMAEQEFSRDVRAQGQDDESLRIGLFEPFSSIMMVEVLRRLRQQIGSISVELVEADQPSLKRYLDRGEVDVVVVYDLGPDFTGTIERIGRAPPHVMVHEDNPLAQYDAISISQLAQQPVALLSLPLTMTYLMTLFDYSSHRPKIVFKSRSYDTIIRSVSNGFGATILNAWPRTPLPLEQRTRRLRLTDPLPAPNVITVDHYGDMRPRAVEVFINILKEYFAEAYHHF